MKARVALAAMVLLVAACGGPGRYPVSRAEVGPNDPVKSLSIAQSPFGP